MQAALPSCRASRAWGSRPPAAAAALLTLLLATPPTARAQGRTIIPAPPPAAQGPSWLENDVTRRFAAWQRLEQEWQGVRAAPPPDFVRRAAQLCLHVAALPTEGEGWRGRRAQLVSESCTATAEHLPACYARALPAQAGWTKDFHMPLSDMRAASCGRANALGAAVKLADQVHAEPALVSAAQHAIDFELAMQRRAEEGAALLRLAACDRVAELKARLLQSNETDDGVRELSEAESRADLQGRWAAAESLGARYVDALAYQLASARIELYGAAQAALAINDDLDALEQAHDGFVCLDGYRDAREELRRIEQRVGKLREDDARETACLADPACVRGREQREQRRREPERVRQLQTYPVYEEACCKVCRKGQACGDSCISRNKTCHKGQGCACDG